MRRRYLVGGAALAVLVGGAVTAAVRASGGTSRDELLLEELRAIMPRLSEGKAREFLPLLNAAMREADILDTVPRLAAFLAQLALESHELTRWEEGASGEAYEGRANLGNTQPGDGKRFKGRGPIQLTGRYNYAEASRALGVDLVSRPADAMLPAVGFRVAAWYWTWRKCNALADAGDFIAVTRAINGGTNGLAQRQHYHAKALQVLSHRGGVA